MENHRIEKNFEDLKFSDDYMFMLLMKRSNLCQGVLERILNIKIREIRYPEVQKTIDVEIDMKSVRLDVYTENPEAMYTIEMQNVNNFLAQRAKFYESIAAVNDLEKGESYKTLRRNIVIFVCTFDPFGKKLPLYNFTYRCDQKRNLQLGDGSEIIFLSTDCEMKNIPRELENLIRYIDNETVSDDFTQELDDTVKEIKQNKELWREYMEHKASMNKFTITV